MPQEIEELDEIVSELKKFLAVTAAVRSGPESAKLAKFTSLVTSYVTVKQVLNKYGLEIGDVQYIGVPKIEIISSITSLRVQAESHYRKCKERLDILATEKEFETIVNEVSGSADDATLYDTDMLILSRDQKATVQEKINALRSILSGMVWKSNDHKERVLSKLNQLQKEFDQEIGTYTRNLGRLVDLGDAIGEFGEKIKPATDRLKDLTDCLKIFKRENKRIGKAEEPLQIPDMRDDEEE